MLTRRFVLTGLIAAPAVITAEKLMPVHTIPKRYATVWGVGHDLEVVEHVVWDQQGALDFHKFGGGIDKFREVTDIVYGFKMPPLPEVSKRSWYPDYQFDPMARFTYPNNVREGQVQYFTKNDVPTAQVGIWDPDRAMKDDIATGGNNSHLRGHDEPEDARWQLWFDEAHKFNADLQAKYPVTGMPDGPDGWKVFENKPRLGPETGWKIVVKTAFK